MLVSVLTTAYNAEEYISEAIESILHQSYTDFEYIICDDGSTDDTLRIIQNYAKKDKRIRVLENKNNFGIPASRNKCVGEAKGKYIVWQDADDLSMPDRIKKQVEFMESHPEVGICGGWLHFFNEKGNQGVRRYAQEDAELRKKIFRYSPVAQPAAIIRARDLDEVGLYDDNLTVAQDLDMSFRLGRIAKFANIAEVVLKYRVSTKSITYKNIRLQELNTLRIREKYNKQEYRMTANDRLYNLIQKLTLYVMPSSIRLALFNFLRNSNS